MKILPALLWSAAVSLAVGPATLLAQEKPAEPQPVELANAMVQKETAARQAATRVDEQLYATRNWYSNALEKLQAEATSRGELDAVLAIKAERESLTTPRPEGAEVKPLPASVTPYKQRYDQTLAQIASQARVQETALLKNYIVTLDELQRRLTQRDDIAGAVKVREERTAAATRLASIPTVDPIREANTKAAVTAPKPTAASPLIPTATLQPVTVAASVRAKGAAQGLADGAIGFDGPPGDGRGGTKGLLWKSDPATLRGGSTWAFKYTRGGTAYGLQIIHPCGRGQAIVYVGQKSVGLATPKTWTQVGFGAGDVKRVKTNKDFDKIFPLKDDEGYEVASRLTIGGGYELFVNGTLVATGHVAGADPLSLTIPQGKSFANAGRGALAFKGENLPLEWEAGWAGLILGPMDRGQNVCENVRFYPGLLDLGKH